MGEPKFFKQPRPARQSDPYVGAFAITPGTSEFTIHTRGLYVGVAGIVVATTVWGDEIIITGALAGTIYPLRLKKVLATDLNSPATATSATDMVGLY